MFDIHSHATELLPHVFLAISYDAFRLGDPSSMPGSIMLSDELLDEPAGTSGGLLLVR